MSIPIIMQRMKTVLLGGTRKSAIKQLELPHSYRDGLVYAMTKDFEITDGAEFLDDGLRMKEQPLFAFKKNFIPISKTGLTINKSMNTPESNFKTLAPAPLSITKQVKSPLTPDQVVQSLQDEGYKENFSVAASTLYGADMDMRYHPDDFLIDKTFRFNDNCGPNGNPIVYAITAKSGVKGVLVDMTGTCSLKHGNELKDYNF